jgi:hypothetical protein
LEREPSLAGKRKESRTTTNDVLNSSEGIEVPMALIVEGKIVVSPRVDSSRGADMLLKPRELSVKLPNGKILSWQAVEKRLMLQEESL